MAVAVLSWSAALAGILLGRAVLRRAGLIAAVAVSLPILYSWAVLPSDSVMAGDLAAPFYWNAMVVPGLLLVDRLDGGEAMRSRLQRPVHRTRVGGATLAKVLALVLVGLEVVVLSVASTLSSGFGGSGNPLAAAGLLVWLLALTPLAATAVAFWRRRAAPAS
jgi:hypothetical protein